MKTSEKINFIFCEYFRKSNKSPETFYSFILRLYCIETLQTEFNNVDLLHFVRRLEIQVRRSLKIYLCIPFNY